VDSPKRDSKFPGQDVPGVRQKVVADKITKSAAFCLYERKKKGHAGERPYIVLQSETKGKRMNRRNENRIPADARKDQSNATKVRREREEGWKSRSRSSLREEGLLFLRPVWSGLNSKVDSIIRGKEKNKKIRTYFQKKEEGNESPRIGGGTLPNE